MNKHYQFFTALTFFVVAAIIYGFNLAGSPFDQKNINEDNLRLSRMSSLKYPIEKYFETYKKLPDNLNLLVPDNIDKLPVDPKTNQPFEYKPKDVTTYSLCAIFATDNRSPNKLTDNGYFDSDLNSNKHNKGYACIDNKISSYLVTRISPIPRKESNIVIFGTVDSLALSETNPRIIVTDNKILKIINLSEAELFDKEGNKIILNQFKTDDKVIVDAIQAGYSYNNFTAVRIQNLSR